MIRITVISVSLLMLLGLLLFFLVVVQSVNPKQMPVNSVPYDFPDTLATKYYDLDSLKAFIGDKKGLPEDFEVAAAIAYSAYPELKDVNVDMILTSYGAPMESNMNIWTLFGPRKFRQYKILLNDHKNGFFDPILLRVLPFDAQVGILAHELGHVVYYHNLNLFELGKWGLCYLLDEEFRADHERTTDLMPVYHGLGSQIYQYAHFVRRDSSCVEFYQKGGDFMDKYYMTDLEIKTFLENHD